MVNSKTLYCFGSTKLETSSQPRTAEYNRLILQIIDLYQNLHNVLFECFLIRCGTFICGCGRASSTAAGHPDPASYIGSRSVSRGSNTAPAAECSNSPVLFTSSLYCSLDWTNGMRRCRLGDQWRARQARAVRGPWWRDWVYGLGGVGVA